MEVCRVARLAVVGVAAVTLASCGFLGLGPWHGQALDDTRDSFETYDAQDYPPLDEAATAAQSGEPGQRDLDALVVGTVVAVEPGRSLTWTLDVDREGEQRIELPFGDDDSMVNTFHLNIEVSDVVVQGQGVDLPPGQLTVGVSHTPGITLDDVEHDYEEIGEVAFVLRSDEPLYDYEAGLWSIPYNSALMGRLGDDGDMTFPLVPRTDPVAKTEGLTISRLKALDESN